MKKDVSYTISGCPPSYDSDDDYNKEIGQFLNSSICAPQYPVTTGSSCGLQDFKEPTRLSTICYEISWRLHALADVIERIE